MDVPVTQNVYEYDNYRFYLRDYFVEMKRRRDFFSHRYFARRAGFSSSSFCAHVIDGKRNLTSESMRKILKGLGLSGRAATYFENLVYYNQARTVEEREQFAGVLDRIRRTTSFYRLNQRQLVYYEEWYYPVIRELAVHGDWRGDFARLGRLVRPVLTPEKARKAVETLLEAGLLKRESDGTYAQSETALTSEGVPPPVTRKMRKEFMIRAIEAMETQPVEMRHIASATVSMSEQTYQRIVDKLDEIRREIVQSAVDDTRVDKVYQFNIQAFPLSEPLAWRAPKQKGGGQ